MDYSGSEWSSGCESGWTSYFDESTHSPNPLQKGKSNKSAHENHKVGRNSILYHNGGKHEEDEEEEEEDLSMVSDASSGPPTHSQDFYYYQDCGFDPFPNGPHYSPSANKSDSKNKKKKQNGVDQQRGKQQHSYLDDTATSPAFDHQFSHKFSLADQFQGNFVFSNQFGTFWQSSHPKHPDSAEPSQMRGKRWK